MPWRPTSRALRGGGTAGCLASWLLAGVLLAGCAGAGPPAVQPPDERFGHRRAERDGGRWTLAVTPADPEQSFFYYPVPLDSVFIRPALFDANRSASAQRVPVEVLAHGALPDPCYALHDLRLRRVAHLVYADFEMRRQHGAVCQQVTRPFRFYFMLPGLYEAGAYTLTINGAVHAFTITAPPSE